jgi:hemolysin III
MDTVKKTKVIPAIPFYTIGEEIANSILHGVGALAATAGLVLLIVKTLGFLGGKRAGNLDFIAVLLFTATMIAMFLISTLYHAIQHQAAKKYCAGWIIL